MRFLPLRESLLRERFLLLPSVFCFRIRLLRRTGSSIWVDLSSLAKPIVVLGVV